MRKIHYSYLVLCLLLVGSCTKRQQDGCEDAVDIVYHVGDSVSVKDLYSEIMFIPLEAKPECLLSSVSTMEIAKDGFVVLNTKGYDPEILRFDEQGHFMNRIGRFGKAKSEYQYVHDFTLSESGDSVIVLSSTGIQVYALDGKFLKYKEIENSAWLRGIQSVKNGYVVSTDYQGAEHSLHFYDTQLEHVFDMNATEGRLIYEYGAAPKSLRKSGGYLYYLDVFDSSFYRYNIDDYSDVKKYKVIGEKMVSYDFFKEDYGQRAYDDKIYSSVPNFDVHGGVLEGYMYHVGLPCVYTLDTEKETMVVHPLRGWIPWILACDEEYKYSILSQDEFIRLNSSSRRDFETVEQSNLNAVKDGVSEYSNFIILKMRW